MRHYLAAATAALMFAGPAHAQQTCRASQAVPGGIPPAGVVVFSPSFGGLLVASLGGATPAAPELLAVVVLRGEHDVRIWVMKPGVACSGPPVPIEWYERARRLALGVGA